MKIKNILVTVLLMGALIAGAARAQEAPTAPALRAWVLMDTSPSNDDVLDELQAVAKALVGVLQPGDRVRVIAGGKSRARLLLTEQVPKEEAGRAEIIRAITEIRPAWMQKANLALAMAVPCSTLDGEGAVRAQPDLVVILTDGRFDDGAAEGLLRVTEKLKALGATVIITGVEAANRALLVEATRGGVEFHDLAHCDPAEWVLRARKGTPPPPLTPAPAPAPARETAIRPEEKSAGGDVRAPVPADAPRGASTGHLPASPAVAKADPVPTFNEKVSDHDAVRQGPPVPPTVSGEDRTRSIVKEIRGTDQVEIRFSISALPTPVPSSPTDSPPETGPTSTVPGAAPVPAVPPSPEPGPPNIVPGEGSVPPAEPEVPLPPTDTTFWSKLKTWLLAYWPVALCALLLPILCLVALEVYRSRRETASEEATPAPKPGHIMAVVDGREHLIGPVNSPIRIHIGSGSGNALRLSGAGVEERHAEVAGNGLLTFRNYSGAPAEVNGASVPPGKRIRLELPALIHLGKATVRFYVRPAVGPAESATPTETKAN